MDLENIDITEADTIYSLEAQPKSKKRTIMLLVLGFSSLILVFGVMAVIAFQYLNAAPPHSLPTSFTVEPGATVKTITANLQEQKLIKSDIFLYLLLVTFFEPTNIKASTYVIEEPFTSLQLARRLVEGDFDSDLIRFTHIEGETVHKIATNAEAQLTNFDRAVFLDLALPMEGKLFPDTYFIPATFTADQLYELLTSSFDTALAPLQEQITASTLTLDDVLILASIIEREANTPESMGLVSSVLQNRLAIGMPLQADASIEYVLDKPLSELVPEDLRIDSPYNTYLNPGLPPTPIGNPGLVSIMAVLEPTPSEYFYYITDETSTFHFSRTYDEHLQNIDRYLR